MKSVMIAGIAALLVAACQTQTDASQTAQAEPDPRQGEEVSQVCFSSQIKSWKPNDRRSVIVERSIRDYYKLDLIGTCQPQDAFTQIGLISRFGGGSCLSSGDRLVTDARYNDGSCVIHRIYRWNADATEGEAESSES